MPPRHVGPCPEQRCRDRLATGGSAVLPAQSTTLKMGRSDGDILESGDTESAKNDGVATFFMAIRSQLMSLMATPLKDAVTGCLQRTGHAACHWFRCRCLHQKVHFVVMRLCWSQALGIVAVTSAGVDVQPSTGTAGLNWSLQLAGREHEQGMSGNLWRVHHHVVDIARATS